MNCREVRDVAETNHEVLRHLETCQSCRMELDARRRVRGALRTAFHRAPNLRPADDFAKRLRDELRHSAGHGQRFRANSGRWLTLAAGLVLAAGVTTAVLLNRWPNPADTLAVDAIGDHRNCALKYRLVRAPVPLEEAAQRFDSAYRVLVSDPPDDISTPDGPVRVIGRHSCAYGAHRFGHVILEYRGHVVSLLVTTNDLASAAAESTPHVIGRPVGGLSVVSVNGSRHAVMIVGDSGDRALTQLAEIVSLPLVERMGDVRSDRSTPMAWLLARPGRDRR